MLDIVRETRQETVERIAVLLVDTEAVVAGKRLRLLLQRLVQRSTNGSTAKPRMSRITTNIAALPTLEFEQYRKFRETQSRMSM